MENKYFLYIRRSDGDKWDDYQLETQQIDIKKHLKERLKVPDEEIDKLSFYKDMKVEGVTPLNERKGFGKLMEDITKARDEDNKVPIYLIAFSQDRISRSQMVLCELQKFSSNKGVTLHYSYYKGEIKPEMSAMMNIVSTFERKNTIRRVNAFFKTNKNNWGDPRVGFGWDFEAKSKEHPRGRKIPNKEEHPILLEIQSLYENGEIITNICKKLNNEGKKYKGNDWIVGRLKFICEKNEMEWCKNVNKDYFEEDYSDTLKIFKIKNFEKFLEDHPQIKTSSDFWSFFNDKSFKENTIKPYYDGVKVNKTLLKKYFEIDDETKFNNNITDRIKFWLKEDQEYSLNEISRKIIEEFGNDEVFGEKIKGWSKQTLWRRIGKAKK